MAQYLGWDGQKTEAYAGVPFAVRRGPQGLHLLEEQTPFPVGAAAGAVCFLGMVTRAPTGECGWVGERFYHSANKLFIGDQLGRIDIHYAGNVMEAVPLIFGVNVWNYELFHMPKEYEYTFDRVAHFYPEPFASHPDSRARLEASLKLAATGGDKYSSYVFAYRPRQRKIDHIILRRSLQKNAGVGIAAITCLPGGPGAEGPTPIVDNDFFTKRTYYGAMDRLARRLYQFADEIPPRLPRRAPEGYAGPLVQFSGSPEAHILTNVYSASVCDMNAKLGPDGAASASTAGARCYGFYSGIGTYKADGQYNYHGQVWARDTGRMLSELIEQAEDARYRQVADYMVKYLYDPGESFSRPNWKRIVNASEFDYPFPENYDAITGLPMPQVSFGHFVRGKENDGHASVMLMLYKMYRHGVLDTTWLHANRQALCDAAEWYLWQMDNPAQSAFDRVLSCESETSYGDAGGYVLYANHFALHALRAFASLMEAMGLPEKSRLYGDYAGRLNDGIEAVFTGTHPRYGRVYCEPESDNWPLNLKRCIELMLFPDLYGYDVGRLDPGRFQLWQSTYSAERELFFDEKVGGAMGYGQAYAIQTALLLDRMGDMSACMDWAARFSYYHEDDCCLVPEGVTCHPSGRFWFRHTDLGNSFQETEIVKCLRLVLGLDDLAPETGLRLMPRLPHGFEGITAEGYPVVAAGAQGTAARALVDWRYARKGAGYSAALKCDRPVFVEYLRVGPFPAGVKAVRVARGEDEALYPTEASGDARFAHIHIGQAVENLELFAAPQTDEEVPHG